LHQAAIIESEDYLEFFVNKCAEEELRMFNSFLRAKEALEELGVEWVYKEISSIENYKKGKVLTKKGKLQTCNMSAVAKVGGKEVEYLTLYKTLSHKFVHNSLRTLDSYIDIKDGEPNGFKFGDNAENKHQVLISLFRLLIEQLETIMVVYDCKSAWKEIEGYKTEYYSYYEALRKNDV